LSGQAVAVSVQAHLLKEAAMPVATVRDPLSPLLRQRLEASLSEEYRTVALRDLDFMLLSVRNIPPKTYSPPPVDPGNPCPLAKAYQGLTQHSDGAQRGPLTESDAHMLQQLHYLCEVRNAQRMRSVGDPGSYRPQSHVHARLLREARREFAQLPFPPPAGGWERSVHTVAADLLVRAMLAGVQPSEVAVLASQELPALPGRHLGGVKVHIAAWDAAMSLPEVSDATANPNVWDPSNPLGNEPDLRRAPVQMEWKNVWPLTPQ